MQIIAKSVAWTALLLLGGVALAGGMKKPTSAPAPGPGPGPGPAPPTPNEYVNILRKEVDILLQNASADPNSVNPDFMDEVANKLEPYDPVTAATVRAKAAEVRAKRGTPPVLARPVVQGRRWRS